MSYHKDVVSMILVTLIVGLPQFSQAQNKGRVTSRPCPHSCKTMGLPKSNCRDWRENNTCYVEDLSRSPFQQSRPKPQQHGQVSSRHCPYSCKSNGLPKSSCRDWREGDICYIEDLTKRPGRNPVVAPPQPPVYEPVRPSNNDSRNACERMSRWDMGQPRIDLSKTSHTGNVFSDGLKIRGSVEGRCLVEAALFEDGRKTQNISVTTTPEFRRFEFEVKGHSSKDPQIRVYNSSGERDTAYLNDGSDTSQNDNDSPWDIFGR